MADKLAKRPIPAAIAPWVPPDGSESARFARVLENTYKGKSEETLLAYRKDLLQFSAFLGEKDSVDGTARFLSLSKSDADDAVTRYQEALLAANLAPGTINRRVAPIKALVTIGRRLEIITWKLEVPQVRGGLRKENLKGPGVDNLERMLTSAETLANAEKAGKPIAVRNYAILRMLTDLGVRRGAVVNFRYEDLKEKEKKVTLRLKGGERVPFTLPDVTFDALKAWIAIRGTAPGPMFFGLHVATKKKAITGRSIFRIIQAIAATVGLVVHPHAIRHTTITAVIKSAGLRAAQHFARHKKGQTTDGYDDSKEETGDAAAVTLVALYAARRAT